MKYDCIFLEFRVFRSITYLLPQDDQNQDQIELSYSFLLQRDQFFGFLLWKPDNDSNILAWFPKAYRYYRFKHVLTIMETKCVMLCTFHKRYISTACDEDFPKTVNTRKKNAKLGLDLYHFFTSLNADEWRLGKVL